MVKKTLVSGAFLMALGILLGAFGAHIVQEMFTPDRYDVYRTAVDYHFYHALGLLLIGVLLLRAESYDMDKTIISWYHRSVWLIWTGVFIFCGSLYLLVLTDTGWLGRITPVGGISFLLGWLCLVVALVRDGKKPGDA